MFLQKKILALIFLVTLILPAAAAQAQAVDPAFNPICWRESECKAARIQLGLDPAVAADGWLQKEAPCDKDGWGKCLPSGVTRTSISFGGKNTFYNIGDYIQTVYNYALSVAGILAVLVLIFGGVQWVTSGGSSERISSAKKRIGGALIGLLIAYLSYAILNTINPALVNLRLPQVFLIKPKVLAFDYCVTMPTTTLFADVSDQKAEDPKPLYASLAESSFFYMKSGSRSVPRGAPLKEMNYFTCGKKFFVREGDGAVCRGHYCTNSNEACVPLTPEFRSGVGAAFSAEEIAAGYGCYTARAIVSITYTVLFDPFWREGWLKDQPVDIGETELWSVCNDGDTTNITDNHIGYNTGEGSQTALINVFDSTIDGAEGECVTNHKGLKGFVLMLEMDENGDPVDEEHLIGKDAKDLGDEQFFDKYNAQIPQKYFISIADLKSGAPYMTTVEAGNVSDIDGGPPVSYEKYKSLLSTE